jgi:hypothetical protein
MKFGDLNILGKLVGLEWDSGNTRGTLLLGKNLRVNFGTAAVNDGTTVTYHTAFTTEYCSVAILNGISAITGDETSGQSMVSSTTGFTWYHGTAAYNGNSAGYIAFGEA